MIGANQPIKVLTAAAGARDAEGRKTLTFTQTAVVLGNLFERSSREVMNGQWTVVSEHFALLPPSTAVSHKDVLEDSDGVRYRVDSVAKRRGPDGRVHHIFCLVVRTEA